MLLLLAQPAYSASIIGDFGKVKASQEQSPSAEATETPADEEAAETGSFASGKEGELTDAAEPLQSIMPENAINDEENTTLVIFSQNASDNSPTTFTIAAMAPIKDKPPAQTGEEITPQISLSDWKFAKEVSDKNEPSRITRYFSKNDGTSWLWIQFVDVYEANSWKWEWYYPSGTFYTGCKGSIKEPDPGYYWSSVKHACGIYIKDRDPASNPGNWNAKFYLDGTGKLIDANFVVSYDYKESKMAKGIDGDGNPITETTSFSVTDDAAYTWFRLENVADPLHVEYKWYAPDGSLYTTSTYDTQNPGTDKKWDGYKLWSGIYIKDNTPANKCGSWEVKVYIDGKFKYSKGFTISGCIPPKKCDIQPLEAWVEKDGEVFNNIKTWHKFESKYDAAYKDYNYDINFDLFGPSGSVVASASNSGTLKPGWWTKWWVQYGVPSGGWQPGSYTSKATVTGQCGGQSHAASNEAYPKIPTPPPAPGAPPPTDFCDGKIETKTTDKYGNNLQGLKIYLDGSPEGTTTADGKRDITIADNGCGKTHTIKATCPNDNFCAEKTSTISYDGDVNSLGFVCKCPGIIPGLDVLTESDSYKYQKNAKVKLNADVKNAEGSLVKNVLLTIYDPFLGANKIFNLDSGSISYGSDASRTGLQAFFLSAYKQGFLPGMTKHKVVVEDKSGKISVNAKNMDSTPLQSALVYLNDEFKGATDKKGGRIVDAEKGTTATVALKCPAAKVGDAYCGGKKILVKDNNFVAINCNCGVKNEKSKLRILLKAVPAGYERGYPIANVNVSIDNAAVGLTNQYGAIDVENLAVGTHRLDVALKTFENGADKHYNGGTDIILKKSREQKTFLLVKGEGPAAFAAIEDGKEVFVLNEYDVNEQIVPVVVVAIYGAIVVGGFLWDAYDYWQCAKKAEDWDPEKSVWDNYKCDSISEKDADAFNDCVDKVLSKNQNQADECVFETGMIMLNFVPVENAFKTVGKLGVKLGGKGAKKLITFVPFIDDAFEGSYKVFRAVKGNEVYIKVVHYAKKGAVYTFKVVDNSLKIFDNAVGLIVNKVARNPDTWKIITEKVNAVVFKTTAADIPIGKLNSIQTIQGILGEKAGDEYVTAAKLALEKEGNEVIIEKGLPNAVVERFKDSGKYIVEYTDTGKGIIIFEKTAKGSRGSTIGEIDGLLFVNGKPTVIESKAAIADNIRGSIEPVDFFKSKVHTVEDLTGQKPEVLLLVPKGEAGKLAGELQSFSEHAGKEGVNFAYDEFPETADDFGKAARLILDDDMTKGAKLLSAYVDDLKKLGMPDDMLERVLKNLGRYSDDIIRKYTHTLYEPGQAFVFRGRQPAEFPVKIADGKEVLDWGAIKIGNADVNLARKNLDFIKNLPEKERLQYAKLSLAHVEGSPNIFISTSKIPSLAANDYGKKGYVFIINPRARNALDVEKTIQKQLDKGEILQSHYDLHADVISKESEVAFIEKIDGEDILGAVKVDGVGKVLKDSFENNPFYRSETLAEDIAKGKEMTGG